MKKNLFLAFAIILFVGVCFGAWTRDWDETTPTNSTVANLIDDYNRYLRVDLRERLAVDHDFSSDDTDTLGYHDKVTLKAVSEPTQAASTLILYAKDVGDKAELHFIDEDGDAVQLTSGGKLTGAGLLALSIPAGSYAAVSIDVDDIANATITVAKMAAAAIVTEAEGVGSVDDDTALPTDGAVKAYVDEQIAARTFGASTGVDSESNAFEKAHAYSAPTDGIVTAWTTAGNGIDLKGYVGATTDPAGAGTLEAFATNYQGDGNFISFPVPKGKYWEITCNGTLVGVRWRPFGTLSAPVDQD